MKKIWIDYSVLKFFLILLVTISVLKSQDQFSSRLDCPNPIFPINTSNLLPNMDWSDVGGAHGYQLQICRTINFTVLELNVIVLDKSEFQLLVPLLPSTLYYWRVRTLDGFSFGDFCWFSNFITED